MSDEFDPLNRELCPDGICIGLIRPDGLCSECGRLGARPRVDPRSHGLRDRAEIAEEVAEKVIKGDLPASPPEFEDRRLCPNGACIGILGADGRCKECGLAESSTSVT